MTLNEHREWKKEHPDFPLTVHPSGQWSKRVRGKVHYFGTLNSQEAALALWLKEKDFLLAGMEPPSYNNGVTLESMFTDHLRDVDERIAVGRLSMRTRGDYTALPKIFAEAGLLGMPVKALEPIHFTMIANALGKSGRTLRTQKNIIMAIRAVFNWGGPDGMGLFDKISFGPRFKAPSSEAIEVEQEEAGLLRFFDQETILGAMETATPMLKIAILLGINCAFYPSDTIAITLDHLHLDEPIPYHDFRRVKTKRRRMAILWPETVSAIKAYIRRRRPLDSSERRLLLTRDGKPYSAPKSSSDLIRSFNQTVKRIGGRQKYASLGSLRHTYATIVDSVPDQVMIDLTMGHTNKSIQKRIYRQFNLDELPRLRVLADEVRAWLFNKKGAQYANTERCKESHRATAT